RSISADDGDKTNSSPGRARNKPLKPLRAAMPGESGGPSVTTLVCYLHIAREAAGALGTRHSPRPLLGERSMHNSGASRRGIAKPYLAVIAKRQRVARMRARWQAARRSNPLSLVLSLWVASRSLSSAR